MIVDAISDLHGHYPKLEGGDLLIVAGDLTARGKEPEYFMFFNWLHEQEYKKKILIAGNHDQQMQDEDYKGPQGVMKGAFDYLCDSGTEFEGLKIWGSPWTKRFEGMNPSCMAFTVDTDEELAERWNLIPSDVDILVTHSPAYGMLDRVYNYDSGRIQHVGSKSLQMELFTRLQPQFMVVGHIHEGYGKELPGGFVKRYVNASHVNENYEPVNKPIRVIL